MRADISQASWRTGSLADSENLTAGYTRVSCKRSKRTSARNLLKSRKNVLIWITCCEGCSEVIICGVRDAVPSLYGMTGASLACGARLLSAKDRLNAEVLSSVAIKNASISILLWRHNKLRQTASRAVHPRLFSFPIGDY